MCPFALNNPPFLLVPAGLECRVRIRRGRRAGDARPAPVGNITACNDLPGDITPAGAKTVGQEHRPGKLTQNRRRKAAPCRYEMPQAGSLRLAASVDGAV